MEFGKFHVTGFRPVRLTVDRIGPFQDKMWSFDFTDRADRPCNYYLFASENGRGKTTLLDLMACMMDMLGRDQLNEFGIESLDKGGGRAQWDILLDIDQDGKKSSYIFSLIAGNIGEGTVLKEWNHEELEKIGAEAWHLFGFRKSASGRIKTIHDTNSWVNDFSILLKNEKGRRLLEFENDSLTYPTLLYFSAYRDIETISESERKITTPEGWGYNIVNKFGKEGWQWTHSLDNLIVWLKWIDDGRFERSLEIVNKRVFRGKNKFLKGVRKDPPEAIIENEGHEHRLDQLSSGEKSLLQICLRMGAHMTSNTILLIDEMDVHLHSKWQHKILNWLKDMAITYPGLTIISSTHSREIIRAFAFEVEEKGLRKSGYLIENDLKVT